MKKLLIGFLAVGLVMGFAMTASAQPNIKASGQLFMIGGYADNMYLTNNANSHSNIANRLRMQFEIQVQEGLKLTTRFDAMERVWGQAQAVGGEGSGERNISWERAYVTFNGLYGVFDVGYKQSRVWGTCAFCDDYDSDAGIQYRYMMGPWTFGLNWDKRANWTELKMSGVTNLSGEGSQQSSGVRRTLNAYDGSDNDHDVYQIWAIYRWATGQAGLRYELERDASSGSPTSTTPGAAIQTAVAPYGNPAVTGVGYTILFHEIAPYVQWISGPFAVEGEFRYVWGSVDYDGSTTDIDRKGWDLYLMGKYTMGAFYGGLEFAYITGDDPNTADKNEAGQKGGGGWDPLLMFGNYWFHKHHGAFGNPTLLNTGTNATDETWYTQNEYESNLMMFKPFVGWKVNPQLEIVAQYAWLKANEKPRFGGVPTGAQFVSDDYGREFDIYASYKVYNNLTYTVGFGYFWTGDYFKGATASADLDDSFLIMNSLNFTF